MVASLELHGLPDRRSDNIGISVELEREFQRDPLHDDSQWEYREWLTEIGSAKAVDASAAPNQSWGDSGITRR